MLLEPIEILDGILSFTAIARICDSFPSGYRSLRRCQNAHGFVWSSLSRQSGTLKRLAHCGRDVFNCQSNLLVLLQGRIQHEEDAGTELLRCIDGCLFAAGNRTERRSSPIRHVDFRAAIGIQDLSTFGIRPGIDLEIVKT